MKNLSKKLFIVAFGFLLGLAQASAQEKILKPLTLEESIEYALKHNVTVKNELLNQRIADTQIGETLAQGLPQLTGSGDLTYNIEVPTSFLPVRAFDPTAPEDLYRPVQFGIPYQSSATVQATQLIFNGSFFIGLRASKVFKELAEKNVLKAKIDVAEAVALAYYGALVAEERLELLAANLGRLDTLFGETKAMNEAGFAEAIDVQRVKVNLNNLRTEFENVQRSLVINKNVLKFQLGIPIDQDIELAESIDDFQVEALLNENLDLERRIEFQQLQINRELALLDIKRTQSEYLPTLSAFGNIGYNAGKAELNGLFEETPDFTQVDPETNEETLVEAHTWNRFSSVGIRLNIPIFDGLLKSNTIRRKKMVAEQVENQLFNLRNSIELEVEQARVALRNSLESLQNQEENIELAREVFRVAKIKYQEGVGSNLEVVEAENALKTAETNYYQALYEALVARVAYRKATGTLFQE